MTYTKKLTSTGPTAGVYTSEFLLSVVGMISLVALVIFGDLEAEWAAMAIAAGSGLYSVGRGIAKS